MMSQNYEVERKQLEAEFVAPRQEIEVQERQNEKYAARADKGDLCGSPVKSSGKRRQKIHIEYDGISFIPLEKLTKKETA